MSKKQGWYGQDTWGIATSIDSKNYLNDISINLKLGLLKYSNQLSIIVVVNHL
jgi:hypothetical protein